MEKGLIQLYTGNGKGKTTAAVGQAIRALGRDLKVIMIQFAKGGDSGEVLLIKKKLPEMEIHSFNSQSTRVWSMSPEELDTLKKETMNGFELAKTIITKNQCHMLILDEIIWAINKGYISSEDLIRILNEKPETMEIILTGRDADRKILKTADLVSEMNKVKHPIDEGIQARLGIER